MKSKNLNYDEFNKEVISLVKEVAIIYQIGSEIKNITYQDFHNIKILSITPFPFDRRIFNIG